MTITPASTASRPALTPLAESLYEQLRPLQFDEPAQGYALARYVASLATLLDPIQEIADDDEQGHVGWQIAADPELCPDWMLGWLAMWAGVSPAQRTEAETRYLIANSPARVRGTQQAMIAAAQQLLTGGKNVYFEERADGNAYQLVVFTWQVESPETDWRDIRNLWTNPSAELNTSDVTAYGGVVARSTAGAAGGAGQACFQLTYDNSVPDQMGLRNDYAVEEGKTYSIAASFRADTVGRECRATLSWRNSGGASVGEVVSTVIIDMTGDWIRVGVSGVAPEGAVTCRASVEVADTLLSAATVGEKHYIDAIRFSDDDDAMDYADGSTPGWEWVSTENLSPSRRVPTNLVENALRAMKPAGITLVYETRPGQLYRHVEAEHETYADVKASYSDYADLRTTQPF